MNRWLALSSALATIGAPALAQDDPAAAPAAPALEAGESAIDTEADGDLEVVKNGYTDAHDWVSLQAFAAGLYAGWLPVDPG